VSSIHGDKGWLLVSFMVWNDNKRIRVRIYPGIRDTWEGRRSPVVKEMRALIESRRWDELARRYPQCSALVPFRSETLERDTTTFRQASERFLAYQRNTNTQSTVHFYEKNLRLHVWSVDKFADKPLKLTAASDIGDLLGPLRERGHKSVVRNVRLAVSAVFNWARGERGADGEYLVNDNPVTRIKRVKVDLREDRIDPFTPEEVRRIVAAAKPGAERRIVTVALGAGLRPSETFGLKRDDIDLNARIIRVRQSYTKHGQSGLKTWRSRRDVNMTEPVYRALREQLLETEIESPWLWPMSRQRPHPRNPAQFSGARWAPILRRAGVKHRNFYQCRHTFATLLLQGRADWRYIADQMGHVDLTMLQKHYWKWRPGSIVGPAVDPIAEAFGSEAEPTEPSSSHSSFSGRRGRSEKPDSSQATVLNRGRNPQLPLHFG
jgi:integrase